MLSEKYFSYMIRIWKTKEQSADRWHASLQDPTTQRIIHFNTLEELFDFIRQRLLAKEKDFEKKIIKE